MIVWFMCEEEGLMVSLETDIRPMIGDIIHIKENDYIVNKLRLPIPKMGFAP